MQVKIPFISSQTTVQTDNENDNNWNVEATKNKKKNPIDVV